MVLTFRCKYVPTWPLNQTSLLIWRNLHVHLHYEQHNTWDMHEIDFKSRKVHLGDFIQYTQKINLDTHFVSIFESCIGEIKSKKCQTPENRSFEAHFLFHFLCKKWPYIVSPYLLTLYSVWEWAKVKCFSLKRINI